VKFWQRVQISMKATGDRWPIGTDDRRLRGWVLVLVRGMWIAGVVLALGLFVVSIPGYFVSLQVVCVPTLCNLGMQLTAQDVRVLQSLGISLAAYATLQVVFNLLFLSICVVIGLVIFWRKSADPMGLLASFVLIVTGTTLKQNVLSTLPPSWHVLVELVPFLGNISGILLGYLFPSGRFAPRWISWVFLGLIPYWIAETFFPAFSNALFAFVIFLGVLVSMILVQIYHYQRSSTAAERQQTKWVVFGAAITLSAYVTELIVLFLLLPHFFQLSTLVYVLGEAIISCFLLAFPLSLGFAILRYRLYDIDVLINRTVVYSLLTGSLVLIYLGLIFLAQFLLGELTLRIAHSPWINQSPLVIIGSTLAAAALFQPLRRGIQKSIDHRFYRSKYDAAHTLAVFTATLRHEVDLQQLSEQLLAVVQETMQPTHVSLWLRSPEHEGKDSTNALANSAPAPFHEENV
jgi:hypothetical protein